MFKNYFRMSYRNLLKNKLFSTISIVSLAMAIGCAISILLIVDLFLTADNFHENAPNIFMIENTIDREGKIQTWGDSPLAMGPSMKIDFPQIERIVRIDEYKAVIRYGDKVFNEEISFVDNGFLDMFTFPLLSGDKNALSDKTSIILNEEMALKYFGTENPIGKEVKITYQNGTSSLFTVKGVARKIPLNASFGFNALVAFDNHPKISDNQSRDWKLMTRATFIQLDNPSEINSISDKVSKYLEIQNNANLDWPVMNFKFKPLPELAATANEISGCISRGGGGTGLIVFVIIALLLVVLACFNYLNIAIVSASRRYKEIGIRKVLGSNKSGIIKQFFSENILLCFLALILGAIMAQLFFLPAFDNLITVKLQRNILGSPSIWVILPVLLIFTGILAGGYPSFYISAFKPISILRKKMELGGRNLFTRFLLSAQFVLTFLMIILCITVVKNAQYQQTLDWGYTQEQVMVIPVNDRENITMFKNEIMKNPDILNVAGSKHHVGKSHSLEVLEHQGKKYEYREFGVGQEYLETMKIRLKKGRLFDRRRDAELSQAVIVNEQFLKSMEWDEGIGKNIKIDGQEYHVAGVVENFHYRNFMKEIGPVLFRLTGEDQYNYLTVRIKGGAVNETSEYLEKTWKSIFPDKPYKGFYQDEVLAGYFRDEKNMGKLFGMCGLVALIISCMGLFGLVSINIAKKLKEISIRKVLGANMANILKIVNREFILLLLISSAVATPLGYYITDALMDQIHKYRVPLSADFFIITFGIIILTASATVFSQIYKAIQANPVDALRNE